MRKFGFVLSALCALVLWTGASAFAHQQKTAITTVLFNARTQNIEVMHRFSLHDAEHAVKEIFGKQADILDSRRTQKQFAEYVNQRFSMQDAKGNELPLTQVGFEVEGKHFWVYQEINQPKELQGLVIKHNALRELWPTQTNTVNVEGKGDIQTLTFDDNIELLKVTF